MPDRSRCDTVSLAAPDHVPAALAFRRDYHLPSEDPSTWTGSFVDKAHGPESLELWSKELGLRLPAMKGFAQAAATWARLVALLTAFFRRLDHEMIARSSLDGTNVLVDPPDADQQATPATSPPE
jgi:hypothetical protein